MTAGVGGAEGDGPPYLGKKEPPQSVSRKVTGDAGGLHPDITRPMGRGGMNDNRPLGIGSRSARGCNGTDMVVKTQPKKKILIASPFGFSPGKCKLTGDTRVFLPEHANRIIHPLAHVRSRRQAPAPAPK